MELRPWDSVPHPASLLGQEICFANRHGQNFCYAKTTSSPCFFGFSNRRIYLCGSLKAWPKLSVKYRDLSRYFGTKYKIANNKPSLKGKVSRSDERVSILPHGECLLTEILYLISKYHGKCHGILRVSTKSTPKSKSGFRLVQTEE